MSEWQRTTTEVDGPRVRADVRDALQRYAAAHGLEATLNASPLAAVETVLTRLEGRIRKREQRTYHLLWLTDDLLVLAVVREEGETPSVHAFRLRRSTWTRAWRASRPASGWRTPTPTASR